MKAFKRPYLFYYCPPSRPIILLAMCSLANSSQAELAQSPLFLTISADPNVLINLSVEGPMGGAAYSDQQGNPNGCTGRKSNVLNDSNANNIGSCYFPATEYRGYFDPLKCYDYVSTGSGTATTGQFNPNGATASDHSCSSKWSGNFLNWVSMTAIDEFIWAMTGGNRVVDTVSSTVVRRAYSHPSWFPVKVINSTLNVAPKTVTPYTDATLYIDNAPPTSSSSGRVSAYKMNIATTYAKVGSATPDKGTFDIKVKVCDSAANKEANCRAYASGATNFYKPEGQIQKNASSKRFALTSYTADNAIDRQGGVLRSNMKYTGSLKPDGSGGLVDNPNAEIDKNGLLIDNPDSASKSLNSGIIKYINKFSDKGYKTYDPVAELFYESVRYFKNLGPTPENYSGISRDSTDSKAGGFWFYQAGEWKDPIQYSCQKNFILAINDAYPWMDKRLPGTAFTKQTITTSARQSYDLGNDWGQSSNSDAAINVKSLTDAVGQMENGKTYSPSNYVFDLTKLRVGGGDGTIDSLCTAKNIATSGLGSVMSTCSSAAANTDGAGRDNSYYLAGLAWYANTTDLRADFDGEQKVTTYMIDTQEYSSTPNIGPTNPLWLAGKYGGFIDSNTPPDKNPNSNKSGLPLNSEWDSNSDGEPDNYLLASDPNKLLAALDQTFTSIDKRTASASAAAANSTQLNIGTQIFQATLVSSDWSGNLTAFNVNSDAKLGAVGALTKAWDVSLPAYGSRKIYTINPAITTGVRGISFDWAMLTTNQQTSLNTLNSSVDTTRGTLRLDWLRGDRSHEKAGDMRIRSSVLGDISNSDPIYVGTEDYGYGTLATIGDSYVTFLNSTAYKNRRPMIYVGANDGMLHGFDANKSTGGKEVLAYVPNAVIPELSKLMESNYKHQYYVDGLMGVGDVHDGTNWHTLLAGTTGAGGRSLFALDITNPDSFAGSSVLWEFTSANDADLGYTLAQPSVVRMENGKWAVIVGNGYDSDNGHAVLFVMDAMTGSVLKKIDTGAGTPSNKNGLSSPIAVDTNNNLGVDAVYAGDLYGNLWKFDVSASEASQWEVAFKSAGVLKPLFVAKDTAGKVQPITSKPNIGKVGVDQNNKGLMVYFGTGKYIEPIDNIVGTSSQVQSFYGLWDQGAIIEERTSLQEQTIDYEGYPKAFCADGTMTCTTTRPVRVVSKKSLCYAATSQGCNKDSTLKKGWALNLAYGSTAKGERAVSYPLIRRGLVVFSTMIPNPDPCSYDSKSFLMEVDALSGGEFISAAFDVNGSGKVDDSDRIKATINGVESFYYASGIDVGIGTFKTPVIVESDTLHVDFKYVSGSSAKMGSVIDRAPGGNDAARMGIRRSWRQLM